MTKTVFPNYKFQVSTEQIRDINRMRGRQVEVEVEGMKTERGELLGFTFYGSNFYLVLETKDSQGNVGKKYIPTNMIKGVRPI